MYRLFLVLSLVCVWRTTSNERFFTNLWNPYDEKYGYFSEEERQQTLHDVKEMFYFGYNNYMKHAYPKDELDPVHCTGRGPDYDNP